MYNIDLKTQLEQQNKIVNWLYMYRETNYLLILPVFNNSFNLN